MGTSIIDGESLIESFLDPLHVKYGVLEHGKGAAAGARGGGGGGGGESRGESEEEGGEEVEEDEETSARNQVIKGLVAGAGKLGERARPQAPAAEKKGVFGSFFGGKR